MRPETSTQPLATAIDKVPYLSAPDRKLRSLHRTFERMERQKQELLATLSGWTEEQRDFRADSNSWSALDVVDHLVRVEHETLVAIRSKMPSAGRVSVKEKIGAQVVFAVMRLPIRIKVPPGVMSVLPGRSSSQNALILAWQEVRNDMKTMLFSLTPGQLNCGSFHHPVSGSMTVLGAWTFLSVHIDHHRFQLDRIRKLALKSH